MSRNIASVIVKKGFAKASQMAIGRRQFIRQSSMAAAGLLFSCAKRNPVISIIGGGLAGLSAGYELRKAGIPFTLYEASGRLGGRTYSIPDAVVDGAWVDFGAEYVDGSHEHLIALAREFNLTLIDLQKDPLKHWTYFFQGKNYAEEDVANELKPFAESIVQDILSLPDELHYSNGDTFRRLDEMSVTDYLAEKGINGWLESFLKMAVTSEYAMEAEDQSALNFLVMLDLPFKKAIDYHLFHADHEVIKVQGGTASIANALNEKISDTILTGHTLRDIRHSEGGYELGFETSSGPVDVMTDIVLLAVPLPVLRSIEKDFRFSDLKEQAIQEGGFGNGSKLAMGFHSRPWREQGFQGYTYTDVNNTLIWDSSQGAETSAGSLTFTGAGRISDEFLKLSYSEIKSKWLSGAETIYPGLLESHNGQISKFCWSDNPLAGGSYTSFKKGQWSRFSGVYGEPFEKILFAGEHCSMQFQGYMNGAIETGQAEAKRIIKGIGV